MDHRLISTILALLLSLSQAHPLVDLGSEGAIRMEDPAELDITTRILQANNGSSKMLIEGDLIVSNTRNAIKCRNKECLWPKRGGIVEVPYRILGRFHSHEMDIILRAMRIYERGTCIRFVRRSHQRAFISITSDNSCYSYVGRTGRAQVLSLGRGCFYLGLIQHELNHALGFYHEHSRSDRDEHVRINWENVEKGQENTFQKLRIHSLGTPYDYTSIMHYTSKAFSKNGKDTITPIPDERKPIGQRSRMSDSDILRINLLYDCKLS